MCVTRMFDQTCCHFGPETLSVVDLAIVHRWLATVFFIELKAMGQRVDGSETPGSEVSTYKQMKGNNETR